MWYVHTLWAFVGAIVAFGVFYLTPLKHVNLIPPSIQDIEPKVFFEDFKKNPEKYVFIDVRGPEVYSIAHASGSVNIPIGSLYDAHHTLPKKGKEIVLICTSGRLAGVAYGYLQNQGFRNLLRIEGGVQSWAAEGLPLEGKNIYAPLPERD